MPPNIPAPPAFSAPSGPSSNDLIGLATTPAGSPPYQPPSHPYLFQNPTMPVAGIGGGGTTDTSNPSAPNTLYPPFNPSGSENIFGSSSIAPKYHNNDEWATAPQTPHEIEQLQVDLVNAGLLKATDFHFGAWDAASAKAYKTVLALANAQGGNSTDALRYLLDHPTLGGATKTKGTGGAGGTQIANTANLKTEFANSAENLTGGDLPASEADAFMHDYRRSEMQAAGAQANGGTVQAPATAEAWIRQNDANQVQAYGAMSRYVEFLNLLGVGV